MSELQLNGERQNDGSYFFTLCVDGEWFSYVSEGTSLSEALTELAGELDDDAEAQCLI